MVWGNPDANCSAHLAVVGNSFSGPGSKPEHLVWWFSRRFQRVTFIHSAGIPSDMVETVRPDVIAFQGLERFLYEVPSDSFTMDQMDRVSREGMVPHSG